MAGSVAPPGLGRPSGTAPHVSVLLPARDAAATMESCLRSLRRQRFTDWECVLIDDGSTDGTLDVARRAAAEDPRIRVTGAPPRGIVAALNDGITRCRGAVVARMDADDLMHRDRLGHQVMALDAHPSWSAVGCHVRLFPRRGLTDGRRAYEAWLNSLRSAEDVSRDAFVECPVAHPTLMVRRAVLQRLAYRDADWAEDYDLILRLLEEGSRVGVVSRRLVLWRDAPGRLSRTDERYALHRFTACKASFLTRGYLRGHDTFVLWGYGDTGKALARALARHDRHPSHIVEVHPGRLGKRIAGAPVVGHDAVPSLRGRPLVVSVAGAGARDEIRRHLAALGFVEGRHFVCAA